jgi:transcriptional regulator with XRE-family HTH domain
MSIGANIRHLRESHRLTQKELGEIAGVSDKAVSTWEKGIKLPRMGAVERLANYFGVPKSAILDDPVPERNPFAKQLDRLCAAWDRSPQTIERELDLPQGRLAMLRDGSALPFEAELHRLQQYFEMNVPI